jgi:hypothetical protein
MKTKKYTIHPAANEFPLMGKDEFDELVQDITLNGQTDLIVVRTTGKTCEIIDGRNRQMACEVVGVECQEREWDGTEQEIIPFIISKNIRRRNLTDEQKAAIIVKLRGPAIKEEAAVSKKKGPKKDKTPAEKPKGTVPQRIAAETGVTEHKAKQLDTVQTHAPELLDQVAAGKISVKAAAKAAKEKAPPKQKPVKQPPTLLEMVGKKLGKLMDAFPITEHRQVKEYIKTLIGGKNSELAVATALQKELAKTAPKADPKAAVKKGLAGAEAKHKAAKKEKAPPKDKAKKKPSKKAAKAPEGNDTGETDIFA